MVMMMMIDDYNGDDASWWVMTTMLMMMMMETVVNIAIGDVANWYIDDIRNPKSSNSEGKHWYEALGPGKVRQIS